MIFLNPLDMEARNLRAGQIVDVYSHFKEKYARHPVLRSSPTRLPGEALQRTYPETNVLVPIRSVAAKSNQPAFKCIRITLSPSDSCEPLRFFQRT